jgi:anti-sigma factor RsiW
MDDDRITELDLMAFVDDQVDDLQRREIEAWLAGHPAEAARVMRDLSDRTALRLAFAQTAAPPSPTLAALATQGFAVSSLPWQRRVPALAAMLAMAALLGFAGSPPYGGPLTRAPDYLDDAVQSHEASLVRAAMATRPPTPWMQPGDIRTAIRIRLPVLPADWRLIDVEVFPSDDGPSAQLLIDAGEAGEVSLFSSRTRGDGTVHPVVIRQDGETVAFWEIDGQSFVLIGDVSRARLHAMAVDLSDNRLL